MTRAKYETTMPRALIALLIGALVGALLILVETVLPGLFYSARVGGLLGAPPERVFNLVRLISLSAFVAFAAGLAVFGVPSWWLLHRLGRRGWGDAMALGFALTFAAVLLLYVHSFVWPPAGSTYSASDSGGAIVTGNIITAHGWVRFVKEAALAACAGAIVGFTVWRIAYRGRSRAKTTEHRPAQKRSAAS